MSDWNIKDIDSSSSVVRIPVVRETTGDKMIFVYERDHDTVMMSRVVNRAPETTGFWVRQMRQRIEPRLRETGYRVIENPDHPDQITNT